MAPFDEPLPLWRRRHVAFLFFLGGIVALILAMSISIGSVRVKRRVTTLDSSIQIKESQEKSLEEMLISLGRESRLRSYARANHLERALPADVLYVP
ncbi:MAG: hypothetical protein ACP5OP_00585 [Leptospirillia bacterium]